MYQVKLFVGTHTLERDINSWLEENMTIELVDIKYNIDSDGTNDYALIIYIKK